MPSFRYRAVAATGGVQSGTMSASDENELSRKLAESNLELIVATPRYGNDTSIANGNGISITGNSVAEMRMVASLCTGIADMLRAGVPLLEAVEAAAASLPTKGNSRERRLADQLSTAATAIGRGVGVAAAFSALTQAAGAVPLAILTAGEQGGDLAAAFARLAQHLKRQADLRVRITKALRYPAFLFTVLLCATTFIMTAVVPQVQSFLFTLNSELPWHTKLLLTISDVFAVVWWIPPAAIMAIWLFIIIARSSEGLLAQKIDKWLLHLPFLGRLWRSAAAARYAHSLAVMIAGGADLPTALRTAATTLGNRALTIEASYAADKIHAGLPLSTALETFFPPFALRMIKAGENSGNLVSALHEAAEYCDREVNESTATFASTIEPTLTIIAGGILAWVMLAVLGPLYGGIEQVGWKL